MGKLEGIRFVGKCLVIEKCAGLGKKENKLERVLVLADLHLGYEEALNFSGVLVSRVMFKEIIEELEKVFERVGEVDLIVLLGDVKHDFGRVLKQEWKDVKELVGFLSRKLKPKGKIVITKGNHDTILEPIVRELEKTEIVDFYRWREFLFFHGDKIFLEAYEKGVKFWVVGHAHPAVKLSDGVKVEKYKCFLVCKCKGKRVIVMPSFFPHIAGSDPREHCQELGFEINWQDCEVKAIDESSLDVLDFGKLKNLK